MQRKSSVRNRLFAAALIATVLAIAPAPAHATSKEIIEMQAQIQQLMDNVQRLQSTMDKGFAVLQHLAEQTADNANQMNASVSALQKSIAAQNEAVGTKLDTASGQTQSLNDSMDELKSRVEKLNKSIQDLQTQVQNMQTPPQPPAGQPANGAPGAMPATNGPTGASGAQTPPLKETFEAGVRDFNAAKYEVATGEFRDVIQFYPMDDMAGSAQFYLGEIAYRQKNFEDAVKAYNAMLEGFNGGAKAPAAQLHKGLALLQLNKKDAGITELRLLIKRHPQTPEASQAHAKLNALGVKAAAGR